MAKKTPAGDAYQPADYDDPVSYEEENRSRTGEGQARSSRKEPHRRDSHASRARRSSPAANERIKRRQSASKSDQANPRRHLRRKERSALISRAEEHALKVTESPVLHRRLRPSQMLVYDSELDEVDYTDPDDLPEVRDYLPIRFRRYGRTGLGGGLMYGLFVICLSIILACFAWMCAVDVLALNKEDRSGIVEILPYQPTGDMPTTVTQTIDGEEVEVPIKVDIDQVASALKDNGIIEYKWLFKFYAQFSDANIKIDPGTYALDTSLDYWALVTTMQYGSDSQGKVQITFPEGYTTDQIFTLLETNKVCSKADLYNALETYAFNYDFLSDLPLGEDTRLEGYLFPDTYEFYTGESATMAISRFLDNLESRLKEADVEEIAAQRNMSVRDVLIMASLIEKEAGATEGERENMASVLYNRLNAGWKLQLDSTLNYIKGTSTLDLTYEDMEIDSPYNTYLYEGLPAGPICNPGMASIQAVLFPASTDYWYWYSVDGVSTFFTNSDEFNAFAASH